MSIRESVLRDHFAARYIVSRTEVRTDFGRVDVIADGFAVEVEPVARWRHGVRQALAYSKETGLHPAVALYGDISADLATHIYRKCSAAHVTVFLLDRRRWYRIRSFEQAERRWSPPPSDLVAVKRTYARRDDPDPTEASKVAAEAMDRAFAQWTA